MKLSLIVPVHNKALFLRRCLDSIVNQTKRCKDCQVIIIEDGSTDESPAICASYEQYGFEVAYTKNQGVSGARNLGLGMADGEYVTFVDADDALEPNAISTMLAWADSGHNIVQFNHSRYIAGPEELPTKRLVAGGRYTLERTPKYWVYVWNKMYRKSFLDEYNIRFKRDMRFGEDEMFNVECLIQNDGFYQVRDFTYRHYFDDTNSICRGELNLDLIKGLDKALNERLARAQAEGDERSAEWLTRVITRHHESPTFNRFGFNRGGVGKYDIVYFVKDCIVNEELRYSLRSVEENFKYRDVWFYGGCPSGLKPDHHVAVNQTQPSKWERVRNMMMRACENDNITEDFWLFNDDFFVLKPVNEDIPAYHNGSIYRQIVRVEDRHGMTSNDYTRRLRHLAQTLERANKDCVNYGVHNPMLINRKKMSEVLRLFPDEPMSRGLYGNYWEIGGVRRRDMKIRVTAYGNMEAVRNDWEFVSTSDESFESGDVGRFLKNKFKERSRFEK